MMAALKGLLCEMMRLITIQASLINRVTFIYRIACLILSACSFWQSCLLVLMVNIKLYEQATNIVSDEHGKIKDICFEWLVYTLKKC